MARGKDAFGQTGPIEPPANSARFNLRPIRKRKRYYSRMLRGIGIAVPTVLALLIVGLAGQLNRANATADRLEQQVQVSYNPSFKVRFDDIGRQVIVNWFTSGPPIVSYSSTIQWPGTSSPSQNNAATAVLKPATQSATTSGSVPIPVITGVTFIGGSQQNATIDPNIGSKYPEFKDPYEETLNYQMVYNGIPVEASVVLVLPDRSSTTQLPVLVAAPVVLPMNTVEQLQVSTDPVSAKMKRAALTDTAQATIADWVKAWTTDDAASLKQISKDSSAKVYDGLGGWNVTDNTKPNIIWQYKRTVNGRPYVVAEIGFDIKQFRTVQSTETDSSGNPVSKQQEYTIHQTMDILVGDADTGLPGVVAWGPAGTWSSLTPYVNGREKDSTDTQKSGPNTGETPTATPTPTPTAPLLTTPPATQKG